MHTAGMNIVLDRNLIKKEIHKRFKSLGDFCEAIGVHRNSLSVYLSGKTLLPEVVEKALTALNISSQDAFHLKTEKQNSIQKKISPIIESLVLKYPELSIVLFGSRARGTERKYSDVDLGIISKDILSLNQWSDIRNIVDAKAEDLPFMIDVVDLKRADQKFLDSAKQGMKFLGGNPANYYSLIN